MNLRIIKTDEPMRSPAVRALRDRLRAGVVADGTGQVDVPASVREIIADVQNRDDQAVIEWTRKLDKTELTSETLRVPFEQIQQAHSAADEEFLALIRRATANIRQYQESIMQKAPVSLKRAGRQSGVRYTPINRVGVYVPGGRAVYPSTVLMTVVPAQVAGVGEIALASPPLTEGDISPMVLALAGELGVSEVYRAAAVPILAALAMGTKAIPAVDKIVGPGNAFVTEAKRQLFGRVGIDSLAGPSEVLIISDESARPDWLAADMLAQAEHNPGSAVLVTTSEKLANSVVAEIDKQLPKLQRKCAIEAAMEDYSAIIVAPEIDAACELADDFAPEHLQIITSDDEAVLAKIRHAGAIFLGAFTPVPLGDYYAGPSHVLPTGGTGRFFGPLSVNDFLKASSVVRYDAAALAEDADDVIEFATREGLTAHARALEIRKERPPQRR
ncbi:MAG: histidinol dehydrogenase [Planctomycetota bacterium]|nr:histidinol dehydrogenase [Planctomycetota bacterium]